MRQYFGGIEAGGTKFVCGIGSREEGLIESPHVINTTTPSETIMRTIDYFREVERNHALAAIGIGSFGPLDLRRDSTTYGNITKTTKSGWEDTDFLGQIKEGLNIPVAIDTDVNAAALGEFKFGAAQGISDFVYITVGTGIGAAAIVNGRILHGSNHPEMGHILIPHDLTSDPFPGICPFHKDCLEGLASGPAIRTRWNTDPKELSPNHKAWTLEAKYLASAIMNYTYTLSPQKTILGGGVILGQPQLLPKIRENFKLLLNNYALAPNEINEIGAHIVSAGLEYDAGVLGAIALGQQEFEQLHSG